MELPIQQFRSNLQGFVDPLLTLDTSRCVPHVDTIDDRHTVAARQHWTDALKQILKSLLSYLLYTSTWCYLTDTTQVSSLPTHHRTTVSDQDILIEHFGQKIGWLLRGVDVVDGDIASDHVYPEVLQPDV